MRKIKFLFLIVLFFLTGCSASYELYIDGDDITEKMSFTEEESVISSYISIDKYIDEELNLVKNESKYDKYSKSTSYDENNIVGIGKRDYFGFDNFKKNSIILYDLFSKVDYKKEKSNVTISMISNDLSEYFTGNEFYSAFADELKIKINITGNIISGNYDYKENNTAIWILNEDKPSADINITYELEKNYIPIYIIIVIILTIGFYILITYIKYKKERKIL